MKKVFLKKCILTARAFQARQAPSHTVLRDTRTPVQS